MVRTFICLAFLMALGALGHAATLIYYDGSGSGTSVTNLGTLGAAGNGTIQTAGTGTVTFESTNGALGAADGYLSLSNSASNGARVSVPVGSLPNFNNDSWSMSGWFRRPTTTTLDTIVHLGSGDGFGGENEFYVAGNSTNAATIIQHYPVPDINYTYSSTPVDTWHSFAVTFASSGLDDGTGMLRFYVNGAERTSDSTFSFGMSQILNWGGIGYGASGSTADRDYLGDLDEFAFYDDVLSSGDVAGLHSGTFTPSNVPEPGRATLLLLGTAFVLARRRRRVKTPASL